MLAVAAHNSACSPEVCCVIDWHNHFQVAVSVDAMVKVPGANVSASHETSKHDIQGSEKRANALQQKAWGLRLYPEARTLGSCEAREKGLILACIDQSCAFASCVWPAATQHAGWASTMYVLEQLMLLVHCAHGTWNSLLAGYLMRLKTAAMGLACCMTIEHWTNG